MLLLLSHTRSKKSSELKKTRAAEQEAPQKGKRAGAAALVRTKINSVIKQQKERALVASTGKPARSFYSLKTVFEIWGAGGRSRFLN
ncbi:MAG TPA: hypothetical protein VGW12_14235 [Pyrinomonadaceae bacterium]|nr:hypothetical protein [Pyrinomonadaceae bacterium]